MRITFDEINHEIVTSERRAAGLSQEQFAERIGVSRSFVALIETGRKELPKSRRKLALEVLREARERRERDREVMRACIERVMPWTEEDEQWLRLERRRRERALSSGVFG